MKNNTLPSDVLELFDSNRITANSLRKFVMESVADFLGDDKHDKACGKLFDRHKRGETTLRRPVRGLQQAISLLASPRGKENR